jgi:hypothetical protein
MNTSEDIPNGLWDSGPQPDVTIEDTGSVVLFRPTTEEGRAWLDDNIQAEPWQYMGSAIAVDRRYAQAIADGLAGDGLVIETG